jgi:hypothetical protein
MGSPRRVLNESKVRSDGAEAMAARLKTYQPLRDFFDLAVAAPSMRAGTPGVRGAPRLCSFLAFSEHVHPPKESPYQPEGAAKPELETKEPSTLHKKAERGTALAFEREHPTGRRRTRWCTQPTPLL